MMAGGPELSPLHHYQRRAATMAIPASLARLSRASRSKRSVRAASIERQLAPARIIVSTVEIPITGTSKRMSWLGLATLTTVRRRASSDDWSEVSDAGLAAAARGAASAT